MLDSVRGMMASAFKGSLVDFVDLESMEDRETMTTNNGGLTSVIRLSGSMGMFSKDDLADMADRLRVGLSSFLDVPGHAVQFFFSQDPAAGRASVQSETERSGRIADSLGIDVRDVLEARRDHLSGFVVEERCLIVVHTAPAVMDRESLRRGVEERGRKLKGAPASASGQMPDRVIEAVWKKHRALVESFASELRKQNYLASLLDVKEALQEIRAVIRPETSQTARMWAPRMPHWFSREATCPAVMMPDSPQEMSGADCSNLLAPDFAWQLCDANAEEVEPSIVRIGDMLLSGFDVTLFQERLTPFDVMVDRLAQSARRFPWRAMVLLEPGGVQAMRLKEQFSRIFAWASTSNRRIMAAMNELREIDGQSDTVVRLRLSFAVWGPVGAIGPFRDTVAGLRSVVQQWGNCHVDALTGDPLATVMSSVPAISTRSTAPVVAAPLGAGLMVSPLSRQASPWASGAMLFRTEDGKLWPYQPGSSRQITWNDLYVGTPGSGKSVMMNALNLGLVLGQTGTGRLPKIGIIDIGMTSSGLIDLIQGALPAGRRSEVVFRRLRNDAANAINPMDTQLGMRVPLASERQFLINFFSVVLSEQEGGGIVPPQGPMMGLVSAAIDAVYRRKADRGSPNIYAEDLDLRVDRVLREEGFAGQREKHTTWWEVVDFLMLKGHPVEAGQAQRFAVPLVSDLNSVTNDANIASLYQSARDNRSSQELIESFNRTVSEIVRDFPLLSKPTRFSLSGASIVSLDLQDVTSRGAGGERQTAMMYMLARQLLTRDFFFDEQEFANAVHDRVLPKLYENHHRSQARAMRAIQKRVCIDEWHRTGSVPGLVSQVVQDMREGRKHNVQIAVASQFLNDFTGEMVDAASSVFIHNAPTQSAVEALENAFSLSGVEKVAVSRLNGPSSLGAPFFLVARIREGQVRQRLRLTLGPVEIWALSTTAEDVSLRRTLYERVGPQRARALLAARFPAGTAVPEIETRKVQLEESGQRIDSNVENGLIEDLASELEDMAVRAMDLSKAA